MPLIYCVFAGLVSLIVLRRYGNTWKRQKESFLLKLLWMFLETVSYVSMTSLYLFGMLTLAAYLMPVEDIRIAVDEWAFFYSLFAIAFLLVAIALGIHTVQLLTQRG